MREVFTAELNELHTHFTEMGLLVNQAVEQAVQAFVNHDRDLAQQVIDQDQKINQSELTLEEKSFELIALQQPVTTDLRVIMTIIKASSDLERMGDHAVSIAKSTIRVKGQTRVPAIEQALAEMATTARGMLSAALTAYVQEDEPRARQIAAEDEQVNQAFQAIYQNCIQEMQQHPETVIGATDYLLVATYLERIGDYVTNLCEWVVYLKTNHLVELNNHNETM
jgi:phosphate transport system protein